MISVADMCIVQQLPSSAWAILYQDGWQWLWICNGCIHSYICWLIGVSSPSRLNLWKRVLLNINCAEKYRECNEATIRDCAFELTHLRSFLLITCTTPSHSMYFTSGTARRNSIWWYHQSNAQSFQGTPVHAEIHSYAEITKSCAIVLPHAFIMISSRNYSVLTYTHNAWWTVYILYISPSSILWCFTIRIPRKGTCTSWLRRAQWYHTRRTLLREVIEGSGSGEVIIHSAWAWWFVHIHTISIVCGHL